MWETLRICFTKKLGRKTNMVEVTHSLNFQQVGNIDEIKNIPTIPSISSNDSNGTTLCQSTIKNSEHSNPDPQMPMDDMQSVTYAVIRRDGSDNIGFVQSTLKDEEEEGETTTINNMRPMNNNRESIRVYDFSVRQMNENDDELPTIYSYNILPTTSRLIDDIAYDYCRFPTHFQQQPFAGIYASLPDGNRIDDNSNNSQSSSLSVNEFHDNNYNNNQDMKNNHNNNNNYYYYYYYYSKKKNVRCKIYCYASRRHHQQRKLKGNNKSQQREMISRKRSDNYYNTISETKDQLNNNNNNNNNQRIYQDIQPYQLEEKYNEFPLQSNQESKIYGYNKPDILSNVDHDMIDGSHHMNNDNNINRMEIDQLYGSINIRRKSSIDDETPFHGKLFVTAEEEREHEEIDMEINISKLVRRLKHRHYDTISDNDIFSMASDGEHAIETIYATATEINNDTPITSRAQKFISPLSSYCRQQLSPNFFRNRFRNFLNFFEKK
ncbi:hypothetical protein SNEBB_002591 [Seison nebaliae]|nr:hypothetical protein SNEBB_002591 [Seison nebaliae]